MRMMRLRMVSVFLSIFLLCLFYFYQGNMAYAEQNFPTNKANSKIKIIAEDHVFGLRIQFNSKVLGESYAKKGIKDKAREFYKIALELDPESVNARKKLEELKK